METNELYLNTAELQKQFDKLTNICNAFDNELAELNQGFVQKMKAIKQSQNELVEMRKKYDKKIDEGDGKGADGVLSDISKERKKLKTLISDLAKDGQLDELKTRSDSFNNETQQLYQKARDNWQAALLLMNQTSALANSIMGSYNHNFSEIESIISEAGKFKTDN